MSQKSYTFVKGLKKDGKAAFYDYNRSSDSCNLLIVIVFVTIIHIFASGKNKAFQGSAQYVEASGNEPRFCLLLFLSMTVFSGCSTAEAAAFLHVAGRHHPAHAVLSVLSSQGSWEADIVFLFQVCT